MPEPIIIQQKSLAQQIAPSVQQLLAALEARNQRAFQQQQIAMERQKLELDSLQLRMQQRRQAENWFLQAMNIMGEDALEDPIFQKKVVEAGLDPNSLRKTFKERDRREREEAKSLRNEYLNALPEYLRVPMETSLLAIERGVGQEQANNIFMTVLSNGTNDEQLQELRDQYADTPIGRLPRKEFLEAVATITLEQTRAQYGIGGEDEEMRAARLRLVEAQGDAARALADMRAKDAAQPQTLRAAQMYTSLVMNAISDIPLMMAAGVLTEPMPQKMDAILGEGTWDAYLEALGIMQAVFESQTGEGEGGGEQKKVEPPWRPGVSRSP